VENPPFSRQEVVVAKASRGGLPHASRGPGMDRPWVPVVVGPMCPLSQEVVLPRGPAGLFSRGHCPNADPPVEDVGLPTRLTLPPAARPARAPSALAPVGHPRPRGTPLGHYPGALLMTPHRHMETLLQGRKPEKSDKRRAVQRF